MVRDAYYYAIPLLLAAVLIGWLTSPAWSVIPALLALFCLWFFRDPQREIPDLPGALVSPGDGKVTDISQVTEGDSAYHRISIFLNVFNVHVNRSPVAGVITDVHYRKGKFLNAMNTASAEANEQNIVRVEGEGQTVVFKQIAGLIARRIVFTKKAGDRVARGERVGMIKFGSRVDVQFPASGKVQVTIGDHVKGGSTVLAILQPDLQLAPAGTHHRDQEES
jgi:phosphatidylserine decarboxylase